MIMYLCKKQIIIKIFQLQENVIKHDKTEGIHGKWSLNDYLSN